MSEMRQCRATGREMQQRRIGRSRATNPPKIRGLDINGFDIRVGSEPLDIASHQARQ